MSKALGILLITAFLFFVMVLSVDGGYMTATQTVGEGGTTFTIQWRQGFGAGTVYFFNGAPLFLMVLHWVAALLTWDPMLVIVRVFKVMTEQFT
jgi:hypothetical protein